MFPSSRLTPPQANTTDEENGMKKKFLVGENERRILLHPFAMFMLGLCAGILARLLDIYTQNLGEIFSQMVVWILLGTLISVYSATPKSAAANTLAFCLGMLITYYAVAALSHGVYDKSFIIGWTIFALCSPVLAGFTWMTKQKGLLPKLISIGIVAVSVLSSVLLFDGFRIYDLLIDGCLIYVLFFAKVQRGTGGRRFEKTGMARHREDSNE